MTITLTVEEIRSFERAYEKWMIERSAICYSAVMRSMSRTRDVFSAYGEELVMNDYAKSALAEWEQKHPRPILIPNL